MEVSQRRRSTVIKTFFSSFISFLNLFLVAMKCIFFLFPVCSVSLKLMCGPVVKNNHPCNIRMSFNKIDLTSLDLLDMNCLNSVAIMSNHTCFLLNI